MCKLPKENRLESLRLLFDGKSSRHDVRRILLVVQNHGVGPDVLEQQRLDEVHAQSISACQAMRRDILRDVRVPAEVVREPRRPRGTGLGNLR